MPDIPYSLCVLLARPSARIEVLLARGPARFHSGEVAYPKAPFDAESPVELAKGSLE